MLTAGKNPVALPDTIHNTCVWGAKKYHPQIHTNGSMWSVWTTYCVGVASWVIKNSNLSQL